MGMLLGHKTPKTPAANTQVLNGVRVNSSVYGSVIPVIIGPVRITMNIIGLWDFLATAHTTPGAHVGKGLGGGGSTPASTSYTYSTAMQAVLGFGTIDHIDALWTSAGKIPVQALSIDFTIPGGGGHIDISDPGYQGDRGVGAHTAYSQVVNDFGSGGSNTLSGTYDVPFTAGATPGPAIYTISNPSAGVTRYTFHSSDGGKTVTINYTTNFAVVQLTAEIVIPGSASYDVPDPTNFQYPVQVNYAVSGNQFFGPGTITGVQQYNANLSGHYTFNSGDIGQTVIITYASKDPNSNAATVSNWSLIQGTDTQAAWSYLAGHHQDAAIAHRNVAMIVSSALQLGSSGSMPQLSFEGIANKYMAGAGNAGCNPADVITAILTDPVWGIGLDPALLGDWSNARNFWQAHGFFIALFQDTQSTAWNVIDQILDAGQAMRFWDDGKLQIAVYGDTSFAGNGAIFEPDTQPVFEFSVDDMVAKGGSEPVTIDLEPENKVFNRVKVEFQNAQNDYNTDVIMEDDPASIQAFGINEEGQQSWHFIHSVLVAQMAANLRLKRMVNIREKFKMTVTSRYRADLKPMKLVTVTWDKMGWAQKPLRVLSIEDTHNGLNLTLEEFPYGIGKPTIHPKMTPQAINANPGLINPGNSDIIALEEPDEMNGFIGRRVRIYANPEQPDDWGGCEIFTSDNNTDFKQLGRITAPAVLGTLTSTLNVGTGDPDIQSLTLTVSNGLQIVTPPTSDFDNKLSLLAILDVAGTVEIVAFKNAALTGVSVYTLDHFHRALFGTTRASHVSGATIIELGESFVPFEYTPDRDGTHLYIKAASFNKFLGRQQDLGDISSVDIVLTGAYGGFFDKTTGTLIFDKITDTTNYKKTTPNQIQYLDSSSGRVIVSTILNDQGSALPGQSVTFTKAAETISTLGFSWGTQTIFRADGSSVTLSASSQSFSSLSSSTTYYFYPYLTFSGSTATMNFLGPYTSPSAAHALEAAFDTRTPMGALSDTTTSSGTGGGGTIDPGGPCPHEDELAWIIRDGAEPVRMPAKDVRDGDLIKGWSFAERKEMFRPVPCILHAFSTMWYRVRGYLVSPCEPVYLDGQWIDAYLVPGAEKVRGVPAYRIEIKVGANEHEEHNYYLDNGWEAPLLIHNPILPRS